MADEIPQTPNYPTHPERKKERKKSVLSDNDRKCGYVCAWERMRESLAKHSHAKRNASAHTQNPKPNGPCVESLLDL